MNTLTTRLALVFAIVLLGIVAAPRELAAQSPIPNSCCSFVVDVSGFPASCLPVALSTQWTGGTQNNAITANGVVTFPINFQPCPPPPLQFFWGSLNGGITKAWFNFPMTFNVNNCCYLMRIATAPAGCILIVLRPC